MTSNARANRILDWVLDHLPADDADERVDADELIKALSRSVAAMPDGDEQGLCSMCRTLFDADELNFDSVDDLAWCDPCLRLAGRIEALVQL